MWLVVTSVCAAQNSEMDEAENCARSTIALPMTAPYLGLAAEQLPGRMCPPPQKQRPSL